MIILKSHVLKTTIWLFAVSVFFFSLSYNGRAELAVNYGNNFVFEVNLSNQAEVNLSYKIGGTTYRDHAKRFEFDKEFSVIDYGSVTRYVKWDQFTYIRFLYPDIGQKGLEELRANADRSLQFQLNEVQVLNFSVTTIDGRTTDYYNTEEIIVIDQLMLIAVRGGEILVYPMHAVTQWTHSNP